MGRWAQRHRSGGGHSINFITAATAFDDSTVHATYLNTIFAASVETGDYEVDAQFTPDSITQVNGNTLALNMPDSIEPGFLLVYDGDTPNVLTPQSILLS